MSGISRPRSLRIAGAVAEDILKGLEMEGVSHLTYIGQSPLRSALSRKKKKLCVVEGCQNLAKQKYCTVHTEVYKDRRT